MKTLLLCLLIFPIQLPAQDIAGVWVGILHNDTTDTDLHYEIVISEHKGKLTGFSYTNFIVDGRSLTGVKSLTINKRFDKLFIEDDKLVYNNYNFEPPKGVKQASILEMSNVEEMLSGRFTTTRTKQYGKPVTGHIYLLKKKDPSVSKLMEILNGLDLAADLSFLPKVAVVAVPVVKPSIPTIKEQAVIKNEPPPSTTPAIKPEVKITSSTVVNAPAKPTLQHKLAGRKIETVQTIYFSSDSLILELYDNGYVDDDSVTVVINGKAFITNTRLSEKALRKTIYITPEMGDSINVVMLAENLGTIAPNSGLAIIRDGKTQYSIAFSGDLNKNAGIILRRKKP